MPQKPDISILIAPAAAGKTAYVLAAARSVARTWASTDTPRVVVATGLQVRAAWQRLAAAGGAFGVRLQTFDDLYADCLNAAGAVYTELSEPVQYRLIRVILETLPLAHYRPLVSRPGFVQLLQGLIGELKAGMIRPEELATAIAGPGLGNEPRLRELALVYAAYQAHLQAHRWTDRAGLGWLAVRALEVSAPELGRTWPLLAVDGFDNLTPLQLALLQTLSQRAHRTVVTLTGPASGSARGLAHTRFNQTLQRLQETLGVVPSPLPETLSGHGPALRHLESALFEAQPEQQPAGDQVELIEAPDREGEVRAALRWLKARLVVDGMRPGEVALLARSTLPYRPYVLQTAAEFGLPIQMVDGLPLGSNPAVAALMDLLRMLLPAAGGQTDPGLPRRLVVESWRSPYLDWRGAAPDGAAEFASIQPSDAVTLDLAARWGRVLGGLTQWNEALDALCRAGADDPEAVGGQDEERGRPWGVPRGAAARALQSQFQHFVRRLALLAGRQPFRTWVGWLEDLIGPDPHLEPAGDEPASLRVVAQARAAAASAERDLAALQALKDVLRGLVWAEEYLGSSPVDFSGLVQELTGAVESASYHYTVEPDRERVLVAGVVHARGLALRAVAVLGLAEGEFPAVLNEDPLLRDADRDKLRRVWALSLEPSTASSESEFFYESVTRARERLLLTRPRLADNGAPWQASPYWEEVRRLVRVETVQQVGQTAPSPEQAASWSELVESIAADPAGLPYTGLVRAHQRERLAAWEQATQILRWRRPRAPGSPFDGDLSALADSLAEEYGAGHVWSASRLESYRGCAFRFFVSSVLGLEPRPEPQEGLDARQLGSIYHRILEEVYRAVAVEDRTNGDQLVAALDALVGAILDESPAREGFRQTAWWPQTGHEIAENARQSLLALAALPGGFVPVRFEVAFGIGRWAPLVVRRDGDQFRLRGFIDRVDRSPTGHIRVIDYKTGGPAAYTKQSVAAGEKLQLPLYALAARDALALGEPAQGFYWHVQHAVPSPFTLQEYGARECMEDAVGFAWDAIGRVRQGDFAPQPPAGGCPSYCPAVGFCWRYRAGFQG